MVQGCPQGPDSGHGSEACFRFRAGFRASGSVDVSAGSG